MTNDEKKSFYLVNFGGVSTVHTVAGVIHGLVLMGSARAFEAVIYGTITIPVVESGVRNIIAKVLLGGGFAGCVITSIAHSDTNLVGVLRAVTIRRPVVIVVHTTRPRGIRPVVGFLAFDKLFDAAWYVPTDICRVIVVFGNVKRDGTGHSVQLRYTPGIVGTLSVVWHGDTVGQTGQYADDSDHHNNFNERKASRSSNKR